MTRDPFGEQCEHARIKRVGLGELAGSTREIYPARHLGRATPRRRRTEIGTSDRFHFPGLPAPMPRQAFQCLAGLPMWECMFPVREIPKYSGIYFGG